MKIIAKGDTISKTLIDLIDKHDSISFAVAWASHEAVAFKHILEAKVKIQKSVIGTHFYQTRPEVLEYFVNSKKVKFVLQPSGTFHPKVYLFCSGKKWDLLIGSANLTRAAMEINSEIMLHVSSADSGVSHIRKEIENNISNYWKIGKTISEKEASVYKDNWRIGHTYTGRASKLSQPKKASTESAQTMKMDMTWKEYYKRINNDDSTVERCDLLDKVRKAFLHHEHFVDMDNETRKMISGQRNKLCEYSLWFGHMKGAGKFCSAIKRNSKYISRALDYIPLHEPIIKEHFDHFIVEIIKAFPSGGITPVTASRLLAMKRPDYFVCVNGGSTGGLHKMFSMNNQAFTRDYDRYWYDLICRVHDTDWWNSPMPKGQKELNIWRWRAAMLDVLVY